MVYFITKNGGGDGLAFCILTSLTLQQGSFEQLNYQILIETTVSVMHAAAVYGKIRQILIK